MPAQNSNKKSLQGYVKGIAVFDAVIAVLSIVLAFAMGVIMWPPGYRSHERELVIFTCGAVIVSALISLVLSYLLYDAAKHMKRTIVTLWLVLQFLFVVVALTHILLTIVQSSGMSLRGILFRAVSLGIRCVFIFKVYQFKTEMELSPRGSHTLVQTDVEKAAEIL